MGDGNGRWRDGKCCEGKREGGAKVNDVQWQWLIIELKIDQLKIERPSQRITGIPTENSNVNLNNEKIDNKTTRKILLLSRLTHPSLCSMPKSPPSHLRNSHSQQCEMVTCDYWVQKWFWKLINKKIDRSSQKNDWHPHSKQRWELKSWKELTQDNKKKIVSLSQLHALLHAHVHTVT